MSTLSPPPARRSATRSGPRWTTRLRDRFRAMPARTRWLNLALLVALALAVVLAIQVVTAPPDAGPPVRTVAVTRGDVTAVVTGSGNAESATSTPVNFSSTGTVTAVNVAPGDTVEVGQVLATIDDSGAQANMRTAQSQYDNAAAALAEAEAGPTEVGRQQDQLSIDQAQEAVDNAKTSVAAAEDQLELADESTRTAVVNAETTLANDRESTEQAIKDAKAKLAADTSAQNARVAAAEANQNAACSGTGSTGTGSTGTGGTGGTGGSTGATGSTGSTGSTSSACTSAKQATTDAKNTRTSTLLADRQAVTTAEQNQEATLDADELAVTTAEQTRDKTLLDAETAITTAEQSVTTAEGNLEAARLTAEGNLNPRTPEQIAQVRANLDGAQVTVDTARQEMEGTVLKAPQSGVVLAVNGEVGLPSGSSAGSTDSLDSLSSAAGSLASGGASSASSTVSEAASSAGDGFVVIANLSALAVTANVPEADAATLRLGQSTQVNFPATGTTATGTVTRITPQSTVTNNVVLYPVTVSLDTAPAGVGVGSTAELAITTGTARDVLKVPTQAITTTGAQRTVTVRRAGVDTVVPVQIGLSGTADTEITGGLAAGDELVLPSGTGGAGTGFPGAGPR